MVSSSQSQGNIRFPMRDYLSIRENFHVIDSRSKVKRDGNYHFVGFDDIFNVFPRDLTKKAKSTYRFTYCYFQTNLKFGPNSNFQF